MPEISIVMPVRNAAHTLQECLDSIQSQSLRSWEMIAVDDGSTDDSRARLRALAAGDPRVRVEDALGKGLVDALNQGLRSARAPIVARMDADDRMHPDRLARQLAYLVEHPETDLVATQVQAFPSELCRAGLREYLRWQNACLGATDIQEEIYVESPFVHPSVAYRCSVVLELGGYRDGDFPEDYDLWLRMSQAGCRMAKIPQVLLHWRQPPLSHSRRDPRYAREAFDRLRAAYLARDRRVCSARSLAFWGAGRRTRRRTRWLRELGFRPAAWVDIDARKIGNVVGGAPVVPPAWLSTQDPRPFVLSYVAAHGARDEIGACLGSMGYRRGRDYLMVG